MVNIKIPGLEYDKSIIITGDLHGQWRSINQLIASKRPSIVLQCGDFGWWPKMHKTTFIGSGVYRYNVYGIKTQQPWNQYGLRAQNSKVYFCPGNHEDWESLNVLSTSDDPKPIETHKDVFFMPRCSTLVLPDGRRVLFMGGALSTDKEELRYRFDWFPEETITQKDIYNLPDVDIDIVISHTSPSEFKQGIFEGTNDWRARDSYWIEKFRDPSCLALSHVLEKYNPQFWFFGHYHITKQDLYRKTRWFALNKQPEAGWWTYLPIGEVNEQ